MGTLDDLPDAGSLDLNLNTNNKQEETKFNWKIFAYNNFWISLVQRDSTGFGFEPEILSPPSKNDASSENSPMFFDIKQMTDKKNRFWEMRFTFVPVRVAPSSFSSSAILFYLLFN